MLRDKFLGVRNYASRSFGDCCQNAPSPRRVPLLPPFAAARADSERAERIAAMPGKPISARACGEARIGWLHGGARRMGAAGVAAGG